MQPSPISGLAKRLTQCLGHSRSQLSSTGLGNTDKTNPVSVGLFQCVMKAPYFWRQSLSEEVMVFGVAEVRWGGSPSILVKIARVPKAANSSSNPNPWDGHLENQPSSMAAPPETSAKPLAVEAGHGKNPLPPSRHIRHSGQMDFCSGTQSGSVLPATPLLRRSGGQGKPHRAKMKLPLLQINPQEVGLGPDP